MQVDSRGAYLSERVAKRRTLPCGALRQGGGGRSKGPARARTTTQAETYNQYASKEVSPNGERREATDPPLRSIATRGRGTEQGTRKGANDNASRQTQPVYLKGDDTTNPIKPNSASPAKYDIYS